MGKHGLKLVMVGLGTLALGGCAVAFDGPLEGKQKSKKKVVVEFTLCKEDDGACDTWDQSSDEDRLVIGFRVPKGTKPPLDFASSSGLPVELTRSSSYKAELNEKAPKGKKYKWFGYLSDFLNLEAEDEATFKVKMKLPKDFERKRFKVRPVAGFIPNSAVTEIDCGSDVFNPEADTTGTVNTWCIYAPLEAEIDDNLKIKIKKQKD